METIQDELNDEQQSVLTGNAIMVKIVQLQRDLTFQMSEIDALYTGVEILMSGHLSQYFVSHPQFEKALRDLHRSLQHRPSRLKLLYTRYVAIITVLSSMKKTDRGRRVLL